MNSKLEERLIRLEKSVSVSSKEELICAIEDIIDEELSLPDKKRDIDLIDEAVATVLLLKGFDTEELNKEGDEAASRIISEIQSKTDSSGKSRKHKSAKIKWVIPIAAVLSVILAGTVVAPAFGLDLLGMTSRAFKDLKDKIWYNDGNTSLIVSDDYREYSNSEEMLEKEALKNLLWLPQGNEYNISDIIRVTDYGECTEILCKFSVHGETIDYSVKIPGSFPATDQKSVTINEFDVYLCEYDNIYQADFGYMGNLYTIVAPSYESLENFIKNLEEK